MNDTDDAGSVLSDPVLSDPLGASDFGDEHDEDVDDIVDPLAGLRNRDEDDENKLVDPTIDTKHGMVGEGGFASEDEAGESAGRSDDDQDALVLGEDHQMPFDSPLKSKPQGRKRGLMGGRVDESDDDNGSQNGGNNNDGAPAPGRAGAAAGAAAGGSTLFERMANLSRGSGSDEEDEDDDDDNGSALNIPRFLGRQNNQ